MKTRQIIGLLLACTLPLAAHAADHPCQVHVFLFVPSDFEPPPRYQERVDQIVDYTEAFLTREFKRWGHEDLVMPFRHAQPLGAAIRRAGHGVGQAEERAAGGAIYYSGSAAAVAGTRIL